MTQILALDAAPVAAQTTAARASQTPVSQGKTPDGETFESVLNGKGAQDDAPAQTSADSDDSPVETASPVSEPEADVATEDIEKSIELAASEDASALPLKSTKSDGGEHTIVQEVPTAALARDPGARVQDASPSTIGRIPVQSAVEPKTAPAPVTGETARVAPLPETASNQTQTPLRSIENIPKTQIDVGGSDTSAARKTAAALPGSPQAPQGLSAPAAGALKPEMTVEVTRNAPAKQVDQQQPASTATPQQARSGAAPLPLSTDKSISTDSGAVREAPQSIARPADDTSLARTPIRAAESTAPATASGSAINPDVSKRLQTVEKRSRSETEHPASAKAQTPDAPQPAARQTAAPTAASFVEPMSLFLGQADGTTIPDDIELPAVHTEFGKALRGEAGAVSSTRSSSMMQQAQATGVGAQIAAVAKENRPGPIELKLYPEELGRLRLTFDSSEATMVISISAERPETTDLMRRHIDQLAREMQALGYKDVSFKFEGDAQTNGNQSDHAAEDQPDAKRAGAETSLAADASSDASLNSIAQRVQGSGLDLRI